MCPACIASAAVMAGSVMSTGIAALAVKIVSRKKNGADISNATERRIDDGNHDDRQDRTGESSNAR